MPGVSNLIWNAGHFSYSYLIMVPILYWNKVMLGSPFCWQTFPQGYAGLPQRLPLPEYPFHRMAQLQRISVPQSAVSVNLGADISHA